VNVAVADVALSNVNQKKGVALRQGVASNRNVDRVVHAILVSLAVHATHAILVILATHAIHAIRASHASLVTHAILAIHAILVILAARLIVRHVENLYVIHRLNVANQTVHRLKKEFVIIHALFHHNRSIARLGLLIRAIAI